mmetsp:Transcript_4913/g.8507  ORF Transcript_4913/g.8507 Transcript_4913/m.8507 type:complete len:242 (+) Transcript_4913:200-925(+)|eukprot:CAMPEP_0198206034 /NCGR_PEP_ID=MMETSP1445-20131203/9564_1 /TAXON_ID=36898 /ORGANISM="Pyramimonas sp., Strain CCMP2087" /LENGTH=241 /DNA_ID=CAMNT_0043878567 /DNA_START=198 /DNA_END=923 /DNA_ORIENTATION=-
MVEETVAAVTMEDKAADALTFDPIEALGAYDNLLSQGAEGRVFATQYIGKPTIIKQRFKKKYRHPTLDAKLTKQRLTLEARNLVKARKLGVLCPALYYVDLDMSALYMEHISGKSVKELLFTQALDEAGRKRVMQQIGKTVAALHDGGLIHGDLTTSNMLLTPDDKLVMIDFGLSTNSILAEDKGVDLYVLERALTSAHSIYEKLFDDVLDSYRKSTKQWSSVFNRFSEVRMRGRKRTMVG